MQRLAVVAAKAQDLADENKMVAAVIGWVQTHSNDAATPANSGASPAPA